MYLYRRAGEGWEFIKQVLASDAEEGRLFGRAVALSGDRLMVGAPADDPLLRRGGGDPYEGASYLFERDAGGSDNWGRSRSWWETAGSAKGTTSPCTVRRR